MLIGTVEVDLAKPSHVLPQFLPGEKRERMIAFDIAIETELGSGKQTYGNIRLAAEAKPRVKPLPNWVETSFSPIFAARFATCSRL